MDSFQQEDTVCQRGIYPASWGATYGYGYQKMRADAQAGDPDAIKRYEAFLAKRREEYHRKKGA